MRTWCHFSKRRILLAVLFVLGVKIPTGGRAGPPSIIPGCGHATVSSAAYTLHRPSQTARGHPLANAKKRGKNGNAPTNLSKQMSQCSPAFARHHLGIPGCALHGIRTRLPFLHPGYSAPRNQIIQLCQESIRSMTMPVANAGSITWQPWRRAT